MRLNPLWTYGQTLAKMLSTLDFERFNARCLCALCESLRTPFIHLHVGYRHFHRRGKSEQTLMNYILEFWQQAEAIKIIHIRL
jgi:hypothetical protein